VRGFFIGRPFIDRLAAGTASGCPGGPSLACLPESCLTLSCLSAVLAARCRQRTAPQPLRRQRTVPAPCPGGDDTRLRTRQASVTAVSSDLIARNHTVPHQCPSVRYPVIHAGNPGDGTIPPAGAPWLPLRPARPAGHRPAWPHGQAGSPRHWSKRLTRKLKTSLLVKKHMSCKQSSQWSHK
jgi:hypothetical protein